MEKAYNPDKILLFFRIISWIAAGTAIFFMLDCVLGRRLHINWQINLIGSCTQVFVFLRFFIAAIRVLVDIRDKKNG